MTGISFSLLLTIHYNRLFWFFDNTCHSSLLRPCYIICILFFSFFSLFMFCWRQLELIWSLWKLSLLDTWDRMLWCCDVTDCNKNIPYYWRLSSSLCTCLCVCVIVFVNRFEDIEDLLLSTAERLKVRSYLERQWAPLLDRKSVV